MADPQYIRKLWQLPFSSSDTHIESQISTAEECKDKTILKFYLIFASLPEDLQLSVLTFMDPYSIRILKSTSGPNELVQSVAAASEELANIQNGGYSNLCIRNSYALEARLSPFRFRPWDIAPPDRRNRWCCHCAYITDLWKTHTAVDWVVSSIQATFPLMAQTAMLRYSLTLLKEWIMDMNHVYSSTDCFQYIAWLPQDDKNAIRNFLDNFVAVALQQHPFSWPSHCDWIRCGCECPWILPSRLKDELEALGITELVARQILVRRLERLLRFAIDRADPCEPANSHQFDGWWRPPGGGCFWSQGCGVQITVSEHHESHLGGRHTIINLITESQRVMVQGTRRKGTVQILSAVNQRERQAAAMLDAALVLRDGKVFDVKNWKQVVRYRGDVVHQKDRKAYWSWEHWERELYLERLFS